jgi:DinB family protein
MPGTGTSLVTAFDHVWNRFGERLAGLDDDEYFWEPVAGCWSLRPDDKGRWHVDGAGASPPPDPAPLTTIAWRVAHIAGQTVAGFAERLFPRTAPGAASLGLPTSVAVIPDYLATTYAPWRTGMAELPDERWAAALGPKWGLYADSTTTDLVLHVFDEVVHHAAEVALLRDLYLRRDELSRAELSRPAAP